MNAESRTESTRATWRALLLFAAAVLLVRFVYLRCFCPYELVADEAQYWDWSRRLDLSYYSKGPGVAWLIALSVRLLGNVGWAVRLPTAVCASLTMLALGGLTLDVSGGNRRAAFLAAALYLLAPVFAGAAQFMTIDSPFFCCWALATWLGWHAVRRDLSPGRASAVWVLLGLTVGLGFLFKYTMLLWIPGLLAYAALTRAPRGARPPGHGRIVAQAAGWLTFAVTISPVFLWNARRGWPTLAHMLGHVAMRGGDVTVPAAVSYDPLWTLTYVAAPLAVLGPPVTALILLAVRRAWRARAADPAAWASTRYALCIAAPILLFYLAVSIRTDVELNWPVAGHIALLVPAALLAATASDALVRRLWWTSVAYGLLAAVGIAVAPAAVRAGAHLAGPAAEARVPLLLDRVDGHRELALRVESARQVLRAREPDAGPPFLVTSKYGTASLLAFYLPDHPSVSSASSLLGGRESSYDYFADTDLYAAALRGRPAVLVEADRDAWRAALEFDRIEPAQGFMDICLASGYKGPGRPRRHR